MKPSLLAALSLVLVAVSAVPASAKRSFGSGVQKQSYGQNDGKFSLKSDKSIAQFWRNRLLNGGGSRP